MTTEIVRVFQMSGGREMVNGEKAKTLLSEITEENPSIIRLSNKSFDAEAAQLIAERLVKFTNVSVVDISDIIAGRPEDEALKVLEIICNSMASYNIIELNISDNALGSKGVKACLAVLTMKNLQKLWICNNGMAAESAELIATVLLHEVSTTTTTTNITTTNKSDDEEIHRDQVNSNSKSNDSFCPPLTLFHFYNNMAGDGGAKALSRIVEAASHQLLDFRFSATRAGMEGCLSIAKALGNAASLKHLDLCDCNFSTQAGVVLCESLTKLSKLETLLLRDSNLGSAGVMAVMDTLGAAVNSIDVTNVVSTGIAADVSVTSSSSSVSLSSRSLRKLDISGNDLSEKGWKYINTQFKNPAFQTLTDLSIDDSELSVEMAVSLMKSAVNHLIHLNVLSLNHSDLTSAGALIIATAVARISSFKELKMDGNAICERRLVQITALLTKHGKALAVMDENDDDGDDDVDEYIDEVEEIQNMRLPTLVTILPTATVSSSVATASVVAGSAAVSVDELTAQLDYLGLEKKG